MKKTVIGVGTHLILINETLEELVVHKYHLGLLLEPFHV